MFKKIMFSLVVISTFSFASQINFTKDDVGYIRKIKLYKNPSWIAQIKTSSGKIAKFCSPKSMIEFYYTIEKFKEFNAKSSDDIDEILVTDYKTHEIVNGRNAYYVYGSNKTSPAGDDLVVFVNEKDAKIYAKNNNGKRIFRFSKIPFALINLLNGDT